MRDQLKPKHAGGAGKAAAIPAPRPTPWAAIYALIYIGVPLIAALGAIDLLLYLVFRYALDRCYGIGCWL